MRGISFFLAFWTWGIVKAQVRCDTKENFEKVFHYVQWKKVAAKKLSEHKKVLFRSNYELEALEEGESRKVIFSKKNYTYFFITEKDGLVSLSKKRKDLKKYHQLFCQLTEQANLKGLPSQKP
ncbi:MAG: hypothetical protein SFU27_06330 [Thermonemataceae bacterium]|nr:hypothetical protein [Thermonemataceae bacterium]